VCSEKAAAWGHLTSIMKALRGEEYLKVAFVGREVDQR